MNHPALIILIVAVVILVAGAAYFYSRERRSRLLREHFGPEYDRVVGQQKSVRKGEGVLQFREKARETLEIRPLSHDDRATFAKEWTAVQQQFVDDSDAGSLARRSTGQPGNGGPRIPGGEF